MHIRHKTTSLNSVRLLDYIRPSEYGRVLEEGFITILALAQANSNLDKAMEEMVERAVESWQLVQVVRATIRRAGLSSGIG